MKEFPVTRYQGSKRKIIPWIHTILKDNNIAFNNALDAFGGTGMVSYLFKKMGKAVTYNDNLKFNFLIGKGLIENNQQILSDEELVTILEYRSDIDFIQKTFKNIYYLDHENKWIDNIVGGIEAIYNTEETQYKKAIAYYALFQSCIIKRPFNLFHRNNLNLRTNDVTRTFGNKTTWEKPFDALFIKFVKEANLCVFDNKKTCISLNQNVLDIDPYGYDLVYLDPPYFTQNGSHETANYFKCYHFLEGLANYQKWPELIDYNSINLRLKENNNENFEKGNIYNTFEELLLKYQKSKIIFSYKNGGLPSVDYIVKILKKIKRNVYRKSIHYKYALNHQNGNAKKNREVLIIGI